MRVPALHGVLLIAWGVHSPAPRASDASAAAEQPRAVSQVGCNGEMAHRDITLKGGMDQALCWDRMGSYA